MTEKLKTGLSNYIILIDRQLKSILWLSFGIFLVNKSFKIKKIWGFIYAFLINSEYNDVSKKFIKLLVPKLNLKTWILVGTLYLLVKYVISTHIFLCPGIML